MMMTIMMIVMICDIIIILNILISIHKSLKKSNNMNLPPTVALISSIIRQEFEAIVQTYPIEK